MILRLHFSRRRSKGEPRLPTKLRRRRNSGLRPTADLSRTSLETNRHWIAFQSYKSSSGEDLCDCLHG
ncbi:hypothetical protein V6N13_094331 [Hibiscus sabdariffa]|uniref:Uncharacterized protein n=1 Tax=Hibiscus sabdariffa TaxID=183260 RepID=A0ABR1ZVF1_9ROSI